MGPKLDLILGSAMCVLFWHRLTSGQDYAYSMPTATAKDDAPRRAQGRGLTPPAPM